MAHNSLELLFLKKTHGQAFTTEDIHGDIGASNVLCAMLACSHLGPPYYPEILFELITNWFVVKSFLKLIFYQSLIANHQRDKIKVRNRPESDHLNYFITSSGHKSF